MVFRSINGLLISAEKNVEGRRYPSLGVERVEFSPRFFHFDLDGLLQDQCPHAVYRFCRI